MSQLRTLLSQPLEKPILSMEFYPPKSESAAAQMLACAQELRSLHPDFVSITYGAGGSTRSRTLSYAQKLKDECGFTVMPHLTCVGHSRDDLMSIIDDFLAAGLPQIMALRGDPPKGSVDFEPHPEGLHYASELVELISKRPEALTVAVAGYPEVHPEAKDAVSDLQHLKQKVDRGAQLVTTQLFFDNEVYFRFVESARDLGIEVPILPGLMPVRSIDQAQRFSEMCGTSIPSELREKFRESPDTDIARQAIGDDWFFQQAKDLLEKGAPGIHLYILNQAKPALTLVARLRESGLVI